MAIQYPVQSPAASSVVFAGRIVITGGSGAVGSADFGKAEVTVTRTAAGTYQIALPFTPQKVLAVVGSPEDDTDDFTVNPDRSAFSGANVVVKTNLSGTATDMGDTESFEVMIVCQRFTV